MLFFFFFWAAGSGVSFAASPNRFALVIGNSAYPEAPLANPANDARDIAAMLDKLGFKVKSAINCSRQETGRLISEFSNELTRNSVALFYYAGHGVQVGGGNYLIPVDAKIENITDVKFQCVSLNYVLEILRAAGTAVNIIILDACRNDPFTGTGSRSVFQKNRGLAVMQAPSGTILVYATAPGEVAADGEGRNGVFTKALLENISSPNTDIEIMLRKVRLAVQHATRGKQVPWSSSSLVESFLFNTAIEMDKDKFGSSAADAPVKKQKPAPKYENLELVVSGKGHSKLSDTLNRKIASQKAALADAKKKAMAMLTKSPYLMPRSAAKVMIEEGEMIEFEYLDDGQTAVLKYRIYLGD
ncbi:caspase family protein [Maridesulfovibrio salexigens]|uniref:caspase family protein n=1 Tax=Maridesulfovibrio salexigens TaxID=880 RepID=UPI0018D2A091|nr:caspase family protein [Maridesulfovibrio salexigens]